MNNQQPSSSSTDQNDASPEILDLESESHEFKGEIFEEIALSEDEGDVDMSDDDMDHELADEEMEEEDDMYDIPEEDEDHEILLDTEPSGPDNSVLCYSGHSDSLYSIGVSPNGQLIATGSGDDTCHLWRSTTGEKIAELRGHTDSIVATEFNISGSMLATGGMDSLVKIWSTQDGTLLHTLDGPSSDITCTAWHPKGDVLLAGSEDATIWMWSVSPSNNTCMQVFAGHEDAITTAIFTPSGKSILSGAADGAVRLWNPKSGVCTQSFVSGHSWCSGPINTLACHHERPLFCAASQDGTARVGNMQTGKAVATFSHETSQDEYRTTSVEGAAFSSVHPWVITGATDSSVFIWDLNTSQPRNRLNVYGGVVKIQFVPDQPLALAATSRGLVSLIDCRTGTEEARYTGHIGMVLDFVVSGNSFYTAGDDHTSRKYIINQV